MPQRKLRKLRWRDVDDTRQSALVRTDCPEKRRSKNAWREWYDVHFSTHGFDADGNHSFGPTGWEARYLRVGVRKAENKHGVLCSYEYYEENVVIYEGSSREEAVRACNAHYNARLAAKVSDP